LAVGGTVGLAASPALADNRDTITIDLDQSAKLRVQICDDATVRARFSPDGAFSAKTANTFTVGAPCSNGSVVTTETAADVTMETAKLTVHIDKTTGRIAYTTPQGQPILTEAARPAPTTVALNGSSAYRLAQAFQSPAGEYLYGFGNVNDAVGIRNRSITIQQQNTDKRTPMFISNEGYGLLFDITSNGQLTWQSGGQQYTYTANATDSFDYYFLYGPEPDEVISGYRTITGQATMLPKNAYGYTQSRNRFASWNELQATADEFRARGIPVDTMVVDYHWWAANLFNNITEWSSAWANPTANMTALHNKHITASISIWPFFQAGSATHDMLSQVPGFFLPNQATFQGPGHVYDPSSQANRQTYWDTINGSVFSTGMDSIWLDAGEPEQSNWRSNTSSEPTSFGDSRLIGAAFPLFHTQALYEGQRTTPGNTKRVNTLSRGAVAGVQRFGAQSWSGDIQSTWASLEREIRGVLNYSAAGLTNFSTDTGGYFGIDTNSPSAREMFLRWLQVSTFNAIMRVHGRDAIKYPWSFGAEYEEYITDYIKLRERLIPYTYSLAGWTTQDDYTMVRPLVFDFRSDENVATIDDQFMFGPSLMIAPIYTEGARSREVYLPAGTWTNFWTGASLESTGGTYRVSAPLDEVPVFVRGGSIVPMGPANEWVDQSQDPTELRVYRGANGEFTLYEDEGTNYGYENGLFSEIPMSWNDQSQTLTIGARTGTFPGMMTNRTFDIVLVEPGYGAGIPHSPAYRTSVAYNGTAVDVDLSGTWNAPPGPIDLEVALPKPPPLPQPDFPAQALVGDWRFDEGEGGVASDSSGMGNHGAVESTAPSAWAPSRNSTSALALDGERESSTPGDYTYLSVADNPMLDLTTEISFGVWVRPTDTGRSRAVLNKGGNDSGNPGFSMILTGGDLVQAEFAPQTGAKTTVTGTGQTVPPGQWSHIAVTWKAPSVGGDGIIRLFVNGTRVGPNTVFNGPLGTNDWDLRLGRNGMGNAQFPISHACLIDDAKLFNYALTDAQIAALAADQSVILPNPINVSVVPGNRIIDVSWDDAPGATLLYTQVFVKATPPGVDSTLLEQDYGELTHWTFTSLQNGTHYKISIKAFYAEGSSQGIYLVATPYAHPTRLFNLITHDRNAYGHIVNDTFSAVNGTVLVELLDGDPSAGGNVIGSESVPLRIEAQDYARFTADLAPYQAGQFVRVTMLDSSSQPVSAPVSAARTEVFVPPLATSTVTFATTPSDATVTLYDGAGDVIAPTQVGGKTYELAPRQYVTYEVASPTYVTSTVTFEPIGDETINVTLTPQPPDADLEGLGNGHETHGRTNPADDMHDSGDGYIGWIGTGSWIVYRNIDLQGGVDTAVAYYRYAGDSSPRQIEVLTAPVGSTGPGDGTRLTAFDFNTATGSNAPGSAFVRLVEENIGSAETGLHDVYVRFTGEFNYGGIELYFADGPSGPVLSDLEAAITTVEDDITSGVLVATDYTGSTWTELMDAVQYAQSLLGLTPSAVDIEQAMADLSDALAGLVGRGDSAQLAGAVALAVAMQLDAADYTTESYGDFTDALAAAQALLAGDLAEVTQPQVDSALADLTAAIGALDPVGPPTGPVRVDALVELLAIVDSLDANDYTAESWAALVLKREAARALVVSPTTAEDVADAAGELLAAVIGLSARPDPGTTQPDWAAFNALVAALSDLLADAEVGDLIDLLNQIRTEASTQWAALLTAIGQLTSSTSGQLADLADILDQLSGDTSGQLAALVAALNELSGDTSGQLAALVAALGQLSGDTSGQLAALVAALDQIRGEAAGQASAMADLLTLLSSALDNTELRNLLEAMADSQGAAQAHFQELILLLRAISEQQPATGGQDHSDQALADAVADAVAAALAGAKAQEADQARRLGEAMDAIGGLTKALQEQMRPGVDPAPVAAPPVAPMVAVKASQKSVRLVRGSAVRLAAAGYNSAGATSRVTWKSSNPKVAAVSASGRIVAKKAGKAKVTASAGGKSVNVAVTVLSARAGKVAVKSVSASGVPKAMAVGGVKAIAGKYSPASAVSAKVTYASSNAAVLQVTSAGLLVAKSPGTAVVTVKAAKKTKRYKVTVT
jgi:alpha-D-xyloside xylohydrolase